MARIRFIGDSPSCAWFGIGFTRGVWEDAGALTPEQLAMVEANPTFEVDAAWTPPKPSKAKTPSAASLKV